MPSAGFTDAYWNASPAEIHRQNRNSGSTRLKERQWKIGDGRSGFVWPLPALPGRPMGCAWWRCC
ncbi:hypothetical protein AFERRI_530131 [Acidithiobacillus ferrivorans]|uniref:Uncharacterized protein n=1 Tax=Acidithiobacillus ferrivorans TaxID=160808 RepID=A0A060USD2_9PROT|nr:hypothetical protein AFERRI_530131 [Acidithiobacillus ferrivorans]